MQKKQQLTEAAIRRGLRCLALAQSENGSFKSLSFPAANPKKTREYRSVFSTALILDALISAQLPRSQKVVLARAAEFLMKQKSEHWSFNYWERGSAEAKEMPYPDDLDDTFVALSALKRYDPSLVDGEAMAYAVKLLTMLEVEPGGPYRTWLVSPEAPLVWRDVDLAVNANIAYFLGLNNVAVPGLLRFLKSKVLAREYSSAYYPTAYPIFYYLARGLEGEDRTTLKKHILRYRKRVKSETVLETALAVSALIRLGEPISTLEKDINELLKAEKKGRWPMAPFCIDPAKEGVIYHSGSVALTTAFALEALALSMSQATDISGAALKDDKADKLRVGIEHRAKELIRSFPNELNVASKAILERVAGKNKSGEVLLLPYWWSEALPKDKHVPDAFVADLGLANLWGWMAYTAYDDILDNEGDVTILSPANVALRQLCHIYDDIFSSATEGRKMFMEVMQRVDAANAWEISYCRCEVRNGILTLPKKLPDLFTGTLLAERSLGHALGPLSVMLKAGYRYSSRPVADTLAFFGSYLAARQLNDDAHDWLEDLQSGRINAVGSRLLARIKKTRKVKIIDLKEDREELQRIFWQQEIKPVVATIERHIKKARKILVDLPLVKHARFEAVLAALETAAKSALSESEKASDFLKAYTKNPPS